MSLKQPTIEALKEGGRLLIFAVAAFVVSYLLERVVPTLDQTQSTVILTFVLRMVDKFVHKHSGINLSGLAPF